MRANQAAAISIISLKNKYSTIFKVIFKHIEKLSHEGKREIRVDFSIFPNSNELHYEIMMYFRLKGYKILFYNDFFMVRW